MCNRSENLFFHCEVVGPIPLDDSQRFLVLTSSGLCKILQEIHNTEQQNINRELIQLIVQQFRTKKSLTDVAQSAVERTLSEHYAHYMQQEGNAAFKSRPDTTLMIRNFNYPLPNEARPPQNRTNVRHNRIEREREKKKRLANEILLLHFRLHSIPSTENIYSRTTHFHRPTKVP